MGYCGLYCDGFSSDSRHKVRRSARSSDLHDHRIYKIVRWEVTQVHTERVGSRLWWRSCSILFQRWWEYINNKEKPMQENMQF